MLRAALAAVIAPVPAAQAQSIWNGSVSADWSTAGNWTPSGTPDGTANVEINTTPANVATVGIAGAQAASLILGNAAGQSGSLAIDGAGNSLTLTSIFHALSVGEYGTGDITISNGASFTSFSTGVGNQATGVGTVTVTGANSLWTITTPIFGFEIGSSGTGTVNVLDGGRVTASGFGVNIGGDTDAHGEVLVSGSGSQLTLGNTTNVGLLGTGILNVEDGGALTVSQFVIGSDNRGEATFKGGGTTVGASGSLTVGLNDHGDGTMSVQSGAVVTSSQGRIGVNTGARGVVTVTGANSRWTMTGALTIGQATDSGMGELHVLNGGRVAASTFTGHSSAIVNLDGAGTQLDLLGVPLNTFALGSSGANNRLDVTDGAALATKNANFSTVAGSGIAVNIAGAGTTFDATRIILGGAGNASFSVSDQAAVTVTTTIPGSTPNFIIDGANASLTISSGASVAQGDFVNNTGNFTVGENANGTLLVQSGGHLTSRFSALGEFAGSNGSAIVTGAGSTWINPGVLIAYRGTGSLQITNGASVASSGGSDIGFATGSVGSVLVSGPGSQWIFTEPPPMAGISNISVGIGGSGTMRVENGAVVAAQGIGVGSSHWDVVVGDGNLHTGSGSLVVTGTGSRLDLNIAAFQTFDAGGNGGTGTIDVLDGAMVTVVGQGHFGMSAVFAGATPEQLLGSGTLTVDGAGSRVTYTQTLDIGEQATGILNIRNGGFVSNSDGYLGSFTNAVGSAGIGMATVTGIGSTWQNSGTLMVGDRGTGTLNVLAGGLVTNTSARIGNTVNSVGTATVADAGSTWTSTGTLTIANLGTGTLTVGAGGTVNASGVTIGAAGTVNLGAGAAAGTLATAAITNNGALVLNHTGTTTLAANISGAGTLTKNGAGTATLTGTNSYAGATSVNAGRLDVNGTMASTITVAGGATLGGTGTAAIVSILSGGAFAPGNSIGTMTVATATFAAGSFFDVEVNPDASDLLNVTNTATISSGATVRVAVAPGVYVPGTEYQILDVVPAGTRVGTFGAVIDDSAFIDFTLDHLKDPNEVWLQVASVINLESVAQTPNQIATATALQALGADSSLVAAIVPLGAEDALVAFDQLSGEIHAAAGRALIEDSRIPREAALDRIDAAFAAIAKSDEAFWNRGLWARGVGSAGVVQGDGNAAAVGMGTAGLIVGGDGRLTDALFLGFEAGVTMHGIVVADRSSSAAVTGFHAGVYGGAMADALRFKFGAAYSGFGIDTARHPAFPGFDQTLDAHYWASTAQVFGELSYAFALDTATIEPYARLTLIHHSAGGYAETGGTAALAGNFDANLSALVTVGLRGETELVLGEDLIVTAKAMVGVQHQSGPAPTATHAFAGGTPFTVAAPGYGTGVVAEAGLSIDLSAESTLSLIYKGSVTGGAVTGAVTATFSGKF